jgi:hypothetical protein
MINEKTGAHKDDFQIDVDICLAGDRDAGLNNKTSDLEEKRRWSCMILPREWDSGARHDNFVSSIEGSRRHEESISRGDRFQQVAAASRGCSPWDLPSDLHQGPLHSEE